jgi:hypothetical protein
MFDKMFDHVNDVPRHQYNVLALFGAFVTSIFVTTLWVHIEIMYSVISFYDPINSVGVALLTFFISAAGLLFVSLNNMTNEDIDAEIPTKFKDLLHFKVEICYIVGFKALLSLITYFGTDSIIAIFDKYNGTIFYTLYTFVFSILTAAAIGIIIYLIYIAQKDLNFEVNT